MHSNQTYIYALFNDGERMTGRTYGQMWYSRKEAREMKRRAMDSRSVKGNITIGRTENTWDYIR